MDLTAYLLDRAIAATTPPGETASDARTRADAIAEMLRAYAPGDMLETMMACQCIMMQFLLDAAMRDASNPHQEPATLAKARAGAISASRTLHQWVTKFENQRKRNELRAAQAAKAEAAKAEAAKAETAKAEAAKAEAAKAEAAEAGAVKAEATAEPATQTSPKAPESQPATPLAVASPVRNGRVTDTDSPLDPLLAVAAAMRSASSVLGVSGSGAPPGPTQSLPAEQSRAA